MRHKLISLRWKIMVIFSSLFLTLNTAVFGVPLSMSYSNQENIKNEHFAQDKGRDDKKISDSSCIVNSSKYGEGEHVPGAGPCEECICHPPNVVCSMMKCPINSGCITIQLPNKCCPKYKCDCEHKGKLYNNGEKINKSDESACRVCFCNGGEIVCTSIVCYTRNDCQGYYLPGDCCPKYDNCSSTLIEQKSRELNDSKKSSGRNIHYWPHSTTEYNEDGIWKRDTTESQKQELPTVSNIITIPITLKYPEVSQQINTSLPNNLKELDFSTSDSILETNFTDDKINTPQNLVTDITVGDLNINEDSIFSVFDFDTDNLTLNDETTVSSLITNTETSIINMQFEELFDVPDIDNSVVITHANGTETILDITEMPIIEEVINSSTGITSTQVEIFNPNDLMIDTKRSIIELSTITTELDVTTEMDYDESKEATTPRSPDKSTIGTPHKLVMDRLQTTFKDEINTENTFTDLEDTTDMFGPNFGHRSLQTSDISMKLDTITPQIKKLNQSITMLPTILTDSKNINKTTSKHSSFNNSITNSDIKNIENNTSINMDYNPENISDVKNIITIVYNNTNFLKLDIENTTSCVNNSCNDLKLNDEISNFQTDSTTTTPFIIEKKVLPYQASPPSADKIKYPKEYPDEFETIQYGPSLTITKKTYTSIPDIVYTTTTMITLPTLDLIYKADKDIDKYLADIQSTIPKPSNNLSPLQNVSSSNFT